MILTLTGNLLAERTLYFTAWQSGKTQRAVRESFQVGGKGINVSRQLANLGARNVAAFFAGGAPGEECVQWIARHGLEHHVVRTTAQTRTGTVVRAEHVEQPASTKKSARADEQRETTFLGMDATPDAAALSACAAWLDAQPVTHALAFCGSFPGWSSDAAAPLRDAIERRIAHGNVYVDTYGPPLAWFVEREVALIKINRAEFDQLTSDQPKQLAQPDRSGQPVAGEDINITKIAPAQAMDVRLAAACKYWPTRAWVITDGPGPVWHAVKQDTNADAPAPASLQPPAVRETSATGSGDIFFACILHGLINQQLTLAQSVATAIPCAAAHAARHHNAASAP